MSCQHATSCDVGRLLPDDFRPYNQLLPGKLSGMNGSESLCSDDAETRWQLQWMYYMTITRLGASVTHFKALFCLLQVLA